MSVETTGRRPRRIRLWHVPIALIVVLIAAMLMMPWHWKRTYRQRIAAVAAAGYPVKAEELAAGYAPPASGENGAQAVLDAASGYVDRLTSEESHLVGQLFALSRRAAMKDEDKAALRRLVGDNQEVLERLHAAVRFSHYHYEIDWTSVSGWQIEPVERTRDAVPLLGYVVLLASEEGRVDDAIDATTTLSVISWPLAEIPTLGTYLSGTYWRDISIRYLERGVDRQALTDGQLRRLQAALDTGVTPEMLERALAGHMCMLLPYFERPASQVPDAPLPPGPVLEVYEALSSNEYVFAGFGLAGWPCDG